MPPKPTPTPTIPASKEKAGHRREEATSNSPANALERKRSTPTVPEHTGQPAKRMRSNSEVDGRPNDEDVNFVNSFGVIQNQVNSLAEKVQQDLQRIAAMIAQGRAEEVSSKVK